jgi:hypothetical protein
MRRSRILPPREPIAMTPRRPFLVAAALASLAAAGCGADNAGLTNGPPPTVSGTTPGARTDLPTPAPDGQGETLGRTGDNSTDAGTGGRGGGTEGNPQP